MCLICKKDQPLFFSIAAMSFSVHIYFRTLIIGEMKFGDDDDDDD